MLTNTLEISIVNLKYLLLKLLAWNMSNIIYVTIKNLNNIRKICIS